MKAFWNWLGRAPLLDEVDRRNARVIQLLLLFLAVTIPATIAVAVVLAWPQLRGQPLPPGMVVSLGMSLLIGVCAAIGFVRVRHGALRGGVRLALGAMLGSLLVNAAIHGFQNQLPDQLAQMLVLILAGLVLGRRALWVTFVALLLMLGVGVWRDVLVDFADEPARAFYNVPPVLFSYLLVALLLDRTTEALRESLRESNARGQRLQQEMQERERAQTQLIHAQKREITERMASGLAHDFNNILAVMSGFAAARHDDDLASDAQRIAQLEDSLAAVETSAERGMTIVRRLLRFSRRDAEHVERFDAAVAVEALQPMLRQLLEARIVLRCALPATPAPIRFERSQFDLMLLNLASNSRDAIADRGHFDIAVSSEDDTTVIEVADDGHGMPAEVAAQVFEPFYSTKPADSGTGLGLAVVRDLVVRAGGHIQVDSTVGVGTRFRIVLPHADAASA
ncbi:MULTISPECIES: sensor histidine kinase [Xanthomonas]|uniref:histidine kinase n=1 Tax=Xanthomonas rydalmerensis TaxID=3046274 RepID=A0ABZ0JLT1_9XANT|nr:MULTISPECIES: HAMP domain-containing sensor histidine kinase [unclassified Xanthomonas]MXV07894.1 sensor histidine kinase [Xanthomonas sp. LMG 9002]WOS40767.1 HAMP domain-containing sensor histidine kinase [Xanthomonas sp. DM-2023]WOS44951.1 HAMP domain-containing sensor histidine kinase [Xanthomonas sp. DM-2023]WOS49131.1 HAMP domain-containing sensor histidine kinase [Xanthomonas sp. DM-2023]WOS53311.1 HAMP domain-containing sensor histidine kinase [Xanthomonas sp. DM-2023]